MVPCTKIRRMRKQDSNKNGERIWCVKRERRERRIGLGLGGWLQCAERFISYCFLTIVRL